MPLITLTIDQLQQLWVHGDRATRRQGHRATGVSRVPRREGNTQTKLGKSSLVALSSPY